MGWDAPERAGHVRDAGPEDDLGEQVGASADDFALDVPAVHSAARDVACACDDVEVPRLLQPDELDQELGLYHELAYEVTS